MRFTPLIAILAMSMVIACTGPTADEEQTTTSQLGNISFEVSCSDEAAKHFTEGMLLLHSFEYQDAAAMFRKAQEADSACAMAYWGEAMTKNHTLWQAQYTEEAHEILQRLGETPEDRLTQAQTELERDFLQGAEILYGDGEKFERDVAYAEHMAWMHDKYPENHEVASLYGLSLLGSSSDGRNEELYGKCAVIAQGILQENPEHPGALHYLIHSYDDPGHAHLALDAANEYSQVAPDAGHALHMPSHIYIALGMWDEVISSNIAAWEADNARMARKDLDNDARNYHALHWLMYAYLQTEDFDKARNLLDSMFVYGTEEPSPRARAYMSEMRATYLIDAPEWDEDLATREIDDEGLNVVFRAANDFIAGMHAYKQGDRKALEEIIIRMNERRDEEHKQMMQRGAAMCSGVSYASQLPNQTDINNAHIMEMELKALQADLAGEEQQAEMWFNEAVSLADETSFMFGPPVVSKPPSELYGEWLVSKEMTEQAHAQFEKALERAPGRRQLVEGKRSVSI